MALPWYILQLLEFSESPFLEHLLCTKILAYTGSLHPCNTSLRKVRLTVPFKMPPIPFRAGWDEGLSFGPWALQLRIPQLAPSSPHGWCQPHLGTLPIQSLSFPKHQ